MGRESWEIIKSDKNFNVRVYRRGLKLLVGSLLLNCCMGLLLFYLYLTQPERDFYATSGVTPPIKLSAIDAPNDSPNALLPPDPPIEEDLKVIPQ